MFSVLAGVDSCSDNGQSFEKNKVYCKVILLILSFLITDMLYFHGSDITLLRY